MSEDVPVIRKDLPSNIRGFCCLGSDYEPVIFLNSRLPFEEQQKTYIHEMDHIKRDDLYNEGYVEYEE